MRHIGDQIILSRDLTEVSVKEATDDNIDRLLRKGMSRFAYARAAIATTSPQDLPPLHLMDHRLRLPRLELRRSDGGTTADDIEAQIRDRLLRMLLLSAHPGGRELVAEALILDPEADARNLRLAFAISPRFVNLVLRGRLGSALELIPDVEWGSFGETQATGVVHRALVYHMAFQTQLLAARGHCINRLLFRLVPGTKAYTEAEACKHLWEVLCAIEKIIEKVTGETKQPPQRGLVKDRREAAEERRAGMELPDEELVAQAVTFFSKRRDELKRLRESIGKIKDTATVQTLHKALFGVTSIEALLFASTRLVQLRQVAPHLMTLQPDNLSNFIPVSTRKLPTIGDDDVARLVFVYRSLILRDDAAPQIVDDHGKNIDLAATWRSNADGNLHASNTTKKRGKYWNSPACKRARLTLPRVSRLADGQRIDVLPDFLLQRFARVTGVLPGAALLAQVTRKREQEQNQRPPNIWRAPKRSP